MSKKGFTLAEVVGVVIILGLLALLSFPQILNLIKKNENKIDESTNKLIYAASLEYVYNHIDDFPKVINNNYCLTINDLLQEQLLTNDIVNDIPYSTKIKVTVDENLNYNYNIDNNCIQILN